MHAKTLVYQLGLCHTLVEMNTGDVSHEESLVAPPKGGSCLNQVLGHITRTRSLALASMGQTAPFPMKDFDPYDDRTGVPFDRANALPFDELKRRFRATQEPLIKTIEGMSPETLAGKAPRRLTGDPNETVGTNLATFVFHECYHVGQTGVLRRVAGKPGVVKPPPEPVKR
jgi:DinB family protein